jgi:hypothetical protein
VALSIAAPSSALWMAAEVASLMPSTRSEKYFGPMALGRITFSVTHAFCGAPPATDHMQSAQCLSQAFLFGDEAGHRVNSAGGC